MTVLTLKSGHDYALAERDGGEWKRGLPPGSYYEGMEHDFEVAFTPLAKWHRKRTPEARVASIELTGWCEALGVLFPKRVS